MAPGGYAWWYLDALSDDGRHALTLIAFIGSVFSPYYAWARRSGAGADPLDHCALNVALYRLDGGRGRWAMTERGRGAVQREAGSLQIGPSALHWDGDTLCIRIDEVAVPWPARVRGEIRVTPELLAERRFALDPLARHHWQPIAPRARVELRLGEPALRWQGRGYLDANFGTEPLEAGFARWQWSRADLGQGHGGVIYELEPRGSPPMKLALRFARDGGVQPFDPPPAAALRRTGWRIDRRIGSEAPCSPALRRTLEDTPFYARSLVRAQWLGEPVDVVHESLSLDRFRAPLVQAMLPLRMPRRGSWR
ncbi:carotenoid 1,2-hydratase [Rivibacter subsaxonicus]|uniref:Hydroxyneurosporene synthase n=1 Tax=Rivibacter subsaxonicus TaxID=457575 RepID=A0A4Q7W1Q4_9BURK|nr:carotenoid 1,2-hydratase [Rivibacter subsaxonicus]RZU02848.1 hydroxyneurosporene synthase [Rivibacter subsaxonicus]